jgi:hypothetical protein
MLCVVHLSLARTEEEVALLSQTHGLLGRAIAIPSADASLEWCPGIVLCTQGEGKKA